MLTTKREIVNTPAYRTVNRNATVCLKLSSFFNDVTGTPYCLYKFMLIIPVYFVP
jgi:hypothetical protein